MYTVRGGGRLPSNAVDALRHIKFRSPICAFRANRMVRDLGEIVFQWQHLHWRRAVVRLQWSRFLSHFAGLISTHRQSGVVSLLCFLKHFFNLRLHHNVRLGGLPPSALLLCCGLLPLLGQLTFAAIPQRSFDKASELQLQCRDAVGVGSKKALPLSRVHRFSGSGECYPVWEDRPQYLENSLPTQQAFFHCHDSFIPTNNTMTVWSSVHRTRDGDLLQQNRCFDHFRSRALLRHEDSQSLLHEFRFRLQS
mmetsp:Transcript_38088/g.91432  ORF Transcript_38088/g.91432 Transcript_38088/m.91432 type:complete len:251 (-) Transcript_38088:253-1005(-)